MQQVGTNGHGTSQGTGESEVKQRGNVAPSELMELLDRQSYRCAMTGAELTPETAAMDHIIPLSRNGSHNITNVQIILATVNRAKNTMTNEEFIDMCRAVVAFADE